MIIFNLLWRHNLQLMRFTRSYTWHWTDLNLDFILSSAIWTINAIWSACQAFKCIIFWKDFFFWERNFFLVVFSQTGAQKNFSLRFLLKNCPNKFLLDFLSKKLPRKNFFPRFLPENCPGKIVFVVSSPTIAHSNFSHRFCLKNSPKNFFSDFIPKSYQEKFFFQFPLQKLLREDFFPFFSPEIV